MSGFISEFFGYRASDASVNAKVQAAKGICPFLSKPCTKILMRGADGGNPSRANSGVCAVRQVSQDSPDVICCPNRMYAEDYKLLHIIAAKAFGKELKLYSGRLAIDKAICEGGAVAVFGQGWGGELPLPKRSGSGAYFIDWVLAHLDGEGKLVEFTAVEVQTIDTTGSYRSARAALLNDRTVSKDTLGLNWENVAKRILPQIIYKGQVLQREDYCNTGLYFVCPKPVFAKIIERLGGFGKLVPVRRQPASVNFIAYDYAQDAVVQDGTIAPLDIAFEHSTTVYKIQEAFSSITLPNANLYYDAINKALYN